VIGPSAPSFAHASLAVCITALAGCANSSEAPLVRSASSGDARQASIITGEEPWTFGSSRGRVLSTPSFRIFTTLGSGFIADRAPEFIETALARYRTAFAPLPAPSHPLDTYLLANRPQWSRAAAHILGPTGAPYQQIIRGGVTSGGRSILYDIGNADTFALLAHEGWHQYTQSTFKYPLPIWLEEGIATVMEGFRWRVDDPAAPEFLAWCNLERFDQLRDTLSRGEFQSLPDLLASSPARTLDGGPDNALSYYAQVWALTLFLMEGDGGTHAPGLNQLVQDAARGTLRAQTTGGTSPLDAQRMAIDPHGLSTFHAYFGLDPTAMHVGYRAFCDAITAARARNAIVIGISPLAGAY